MARSLRQPRTPTLRPVDPTCNRKPTPEEAWNAAEFDLWLKAFEHLVRDTLKPWLEPLTTDQCNVALDRLGAFLLSLRPPSAPKNKRGRRPYFSPERSRRVRRLFEAYKDQAIHAGKTTDDAIADAHARVKWWTGHSPRIALSKTKTRKRKRQSPSAKPEKSAI